MAFASTAELRRGMLAGCRVLHHFRIVEGFGHISARISGSDRILMTPRKALGLVREDELIELDGQGVPVAGEGRPALECAMHLAVYRRRPEVQAIARGHPRHVAAYACAAEPIRVAHGLGANLGAEIGVYAPPFLVKNAEMGDAVAAALGDSNGVILRANGMLAVGTSIAHACVHALLMEETAQLQLLATAAGMTPRPFSRDEVARRRDDDLVHEPLRAWEYYLAVADGLLP